MATVIPRRDYLFYPGEAGDVLRALLAGRFREGPDVAAFERALAALVGARHAVATATGRQGMILLLRAHGLSPGDEVIVPAYTLLDLVKLLQQERLVPVAVDVHPETFTINPDLVEAAVTPRTRAIIGCHLFGLPFDVEAVAAVAERHHLLLFEDCAHAAGATYQGRPVGSFGDGAFFSLQVIKPINCFGGGVITTADEAVADFCRQRIAGLPVGRVALLKKMALAAAEQALLKSPLFGPVVGLLARESTQALFAHLYQRTRAGARRGDRRFANVQALVGLAQLPGLEARRRRRAALARRLIDQLDPAIRVQRAHYEATSAWYFLVAATPVDASPLRRSLLSLGIDVGIRAEITDDCPRDERRFPVTARLYRTAIQVPLYPRLRFYHMDRIAQAINRAVAGGECGAAAPGCQERAGEGACATPLRQSAFPPGGC